MTVSVVSVSRMTELTKWASEKKPHQQSEDNLFSLKKGEYNIDYVINVCETILSQCEKHKFDSERLSFSLKHSLSRLLKHLYQERDSFQQINPMILITCDRCEASEVIPKSMEMIYECPCRFRIE